MQQALEALEQLDGIDTETECVTIDVGDAIAALRTALEQPEQEPVVCPIGLDKKGASQVCSAGYCDVCKQQPEQELSQWRDMVVVNLVREGINKHKARELADHFAAQPDYEFDYKLAFNEWLDKTEWVQEKINSGHLGVRYLGMHRADVLRDLAYPNTVTGKAPQQRPWVGLEAEEILDLFDRNNVYGSKWIEFARTVEAKLKAKNV
jgi:hypothetical protein